jgi:hypothetical protein
MTDTRKKSHDLIHAADDPHACPVARRTAIARLRDMSREERLALLMANFSLDCGEGLGMPRRGAPTARKGAFKSARNGAKR